MENSSQYTLKTTRHGTIVLKTCMDCAEQHTHTYIFWMFVQLSPWAIPTLKSGYGHSGTIYLWKIYSKSMLAKEPEGVFWNLADEIISTSLFHKGQQTSM